jgi:hypothetical protein
VTLSEPGDVSMRGSFFVTSGPSFPIGPFTRDVRANVPVRIRIRISRKVKRAVKRGARRGKETRGALTTVGRDSACFKNRSHSDRLFKLVP